MISSALTEYSIKNLHDFDNSSFLYTERNYFKRTFMEMLHIGQTSNSVNKKTDLKDLSVIYKY